MESENKFEIDTATSVDEAIDKLKTHSYDAVVSDSEMPLKSGLDFLKELREQKNSIAFIVFTGEDRVVTIRALDMGADRCINKNGPPEAVFTELADAIREIVTERNQARAYEEVRIQDERALAAYPLKFAFSGECPRALSRLASSGLPPYKYVLTLCLKSYPPLT